MLGIFRLFYFSNSLRYCSPWNFNRILYCNGSLASTKTNFVCIYFLYSACYFPWFWSIFEFAALKTGRADSASLSLRGGFWLMGCRWPIAFLLNLILETNLWNQVDAMIPKLNRCFLLWSFLWKMEIGSTKLFFWKETQIESAKILCTKNLHQMIFIVTTTMMMLGCLPRRCYGDGLVEIFHCSHQR